MTDINEIGIFDVNTDELLLRCIDWTEAGRVLCDRGGAWEVTTTENRHGDPMYRLMVGGTCVEHQNAVTHETIEAADADAQTKADAEKDMLESIARFSNTLENGFCGAYARVIESAEVAA